MAERPREKFSMETLVEGDLTRIVIGGDLDRARADQLRQAGMEAASNADHLEVDLVATTVIDSAALGVLVHIHHRAIDEGCLFDVHIGRPYQKVLFDIAGLSEHLRLVEVNNG